MKRKSEKRTPFPGSELRLRERELTMIEHLPGLAVRASPLHGLGCFAAQPFSKGRKIAEYAGARRRWDELAAEDAPWEMNYIIGLDDEWVVDASRSGNQTRYINHSCDANVFLRVTRMHAIFYALRDIAPGEELTWRYYMIDEDGHAEPCPCEKR